MGWFSVHHEQAFNATCISDWCPWFAVWEGDESVSGEEWHFDVVEHGLEGSIADEGHECWEVAVVSDACAICDGPFFGLWMGVDNGPVCVNASARRWGGIWFVPRILIE